MRELELAVHPLLDTGRSPRIGDRARFPLSRAAFVLSIGVHVIAVYALSRQVWPGPEPEQSFIAEFFLFELPRPRPSDPIPSPAPEQPPPEVREQPEPVTSPAPPPVSPPEQATEPVAEPSVAVERSAEPQPAPLPAPAIDFEQARQRAAEEIVTERNAEKEYLTFSIDDVAPPRPEAEPEPERSIFDDGPSFGNRVLQPGQARTKLGRKLLDFCNALTGGFGVAFQGFGLFSACAQPDDEPSGLFPEVRPAYLDLLPECVETRDTAPQLARESPFPTIKCRLVKPVAEEQP